MAAIRPSLSRFLFCNGKFSCIIQLISPFFCTFTSHSFASDGFYSMCVCVCLHDTVFTIWTMKIVTIAFSLSLAHTYIHHRMVPWMYLTFSLLVFHPETPKLANIVSFSVRWWWKAYKLFIRIMIVIALWGKHSPSELTPPPPWQWTERMYVCRVAGKLREKLRRKMKKSWCGSAHVRKYVHWEC